MRSLHSSSDLQCLHSYQHTYLIHCFILTSCLCFALKVSCMWPVKLHTERVTILCVARQRCNSDFVSITQFTRNCYLGGVDCISPLTPHALASSESVQHPWTVTPHILASVSWCWVESVLPFELIKPTAQTSISVIAGLVHNIVTSRILSRDVIQTWLLQMQNHLSR